MNQYLRKWIDETYPLMGNDIEELDHFDLQKFADWMEEQLAISGVSKSFYCDNTVEEGMLNCGDQCDFCKEHHKNVC